MEKPTPEQASRDALALTLATLLDSLYDLPAVTLLPQSVKNAAEAAATALDAYIATSTSASRARVEWLAARMVGEDA